MNLFVLLFLSCVLLSNRVFSAGDKLIVVLIDGVRYDYLDNPNLKGFRKLINSGVQADYVVPIFPSISYPNWLTIVTGRYAENHGFVDNNMYDSETKKFYHGNDDPSGSDPIWWSEAEPLWITAERNKLSTAMHWWGGCEVRFENVLHPMICERERYNHPSPEETKDFLERFDDMINLFKPSARFPKGRLSLALMYYGDTDLAGHEYGTRSQQVTDALLDIDNILYELQRKLEKAGLKNEVNIVVVSDHGMADYPDSRPVDLEPFKEDIEYQVSSMINTLLVPKEGREDKLYNDLKAAKIKGIDIFKKEEIPTKYHLKGAKTMNPIYLVSHPGYSVNRLMTQELNETANDGSRSISKFHNPSKNGSNAYIGYHGYYPDIVHDMRTIFIASGPAFKVGYKNEALNMTDIYNVMCKVLNLKPQPNNGTWAKVSGMLKTEKELKELYSQPLTGSSNSIFYNHFICCMFISLFIIVLDMMNFNNV